MFLGCKRPSSFVNRDDVTRGKGGREIRSEVAAVLVGRRWGKKGSTVKYAAAEEEPRRADRGVSVNAKGVCFSNFISLFLVLRGGGGGCECPLSQCAGMF